MDSQTIDTGLKVELAEDAIVIRLPLAALKTAVEHHPDMYWYQDGEYLRVKLTDARKLAAAVVDALHDESETGITLATEMFDDAILQAVENGAEGVSAPDDEDYDEAMEAPNDPR